MTSEQEKTLESIKLQRLLTKLNVLLTESPPDDPPYSPTAASGYAYERARLDTAGFYEEAIKEAIDATEKLTLADLDAGGCG